MFNLVIFGPPGSGKGTQSENIINKYGLVHLSTGDLLRAEKNSGSELGNKIKELIDNGNLVPDSMVEEMVKKNVAKNKDAAGFIFDGFPRTTTQAAWLDNMLAEHGQSVTLMLALDVDDNELRTRILERGKVSGRADDQNVSIIDNRISVYHKQTQPVMDFYSAQGKFVSVDGIGSLDEVFSRISTAMDNTMLQCCNN
ncbi:MAG: adenylate kinase [Salinivirgaceae bacterium]|nr:adenylate kinase [Salinivirgaceae bacterium]MBR2771984.1 adenylate kinase [Bacteroidales bacterium]MBR3567330.1 adenylate kinase [Salinivirgaceae bacterium]MBR4621667.1 adenylate kinase [Salinivirgaceae bacterium]